MVRDSCRRSPLLGMWRKQPELNPVIHRKRSETSREAFLDRKKSNDEFYLNVGHRSEFAEMFVQF